MDAGPESIRPGPAASSFLFRLPALHGPAPVRTASKKDAPPLVWCLLQQTLLELLFAMQNFRASLSQAAVRLPAMSGADAQTSEMAGWVRVLVDSRPELPRPEGIAFAARTLGLPRSRARAFFYRLVPAALAAEWVGARDRFDRWVDLELQRTAAANDLARIRLEAAAQRSCDS